MHICPYYYIDHGTLNPSEFQLCAVFVLRDKPGNHPFRKAKFSLLIWLYCPSPKLMASCFLSFFFPQVIVLKLTKYFFRYAKSINFTERHFTWHRISLIGIWQHNKILLKHFYSLLGFHLYLLLPNLR